MFKVNILTAYPDMFPGSLGYSILGKALSEKKWSLNIVNLHNFGFDDRNSIDDQPFGGGPGMIIRPDVVEKAVLSLGKKNTKKTQFIYLTPSGIPLKQSNLLKFIEFDELVLLCGRFEGVDQRVVDSLNFIEISIGDYILAGGEIASKVLVEGCIRLIPGVIGQPKSLLEESFSDSLLEYPQYTRPQVWKDAQNVKHGVPKILISGHHENIKKWRKNKSIEKTIDFRPDLLNNKNRNKENE